MLVCQMNTVFIKRLTEVEGIVGFAWSCHVRFFSGLHILE